MQKAKQFAAVLSIVSNATLILLKVLVSLLTGSVSIFSEAMHSFSDILASFLAFFSVKKSAEPEDDDHQYGHGKFEDFSGFIEGLLIYAISFYIIYEGISKLIHNQTQEFDTTLGILVMLFSVIANVFVSKFIFSVGKKYDSIALIADAEHLNTDILSSMAVLVGLLLIKITGWTIIDPILAIIVALIIMKTATQLCWQTGNNLLDISLPKEDIEKICGIANFFVPEKIIKVKTCKTRKSGCNRLIELTLIVAKNITIKEGHDICDEIEDAILSEFEHAKITIHLEPQD